MDFVGNYFRIDPKLLTPHIYEYRQENAVRHLFRVACSLDSMVIGEPQILGQVKSSYLAARSAGAIRGHLDKVLQRAFVVAKRVRTETQIGTRRYPLPRSPWSWQRKSLARSKTRRF